MSEVAFVSGGNRGIGRAICLGLAMDGFDIWLNYRSGHAEAEEVKTEILALGRSCQLLPFSVMSNRETVEALQPHLQNATPFVIVNNAGFSRDGIFGLMNESNWHDVIAVTLDGFYNVTHAILPYMIRRRKGRVVSISSISGQTGNAGQVNYSAAKAGLIGASKALAREIGKRGITVNVVAPGFIETAMTSRLSPEHKKHILDAIPLGRSGLPEDVAGCVRFLCSDLASYITAQVIAVNGGLYA